MTAPKPEDFISTYEAALATQDWSKVEPLVHSHVSVTFSNGSVYEGKVAVEAAFTRNFSLVKGERYAISNVRWVSKSDEMAVYLFDFAWSGIIDSEPASGGGRGTGILIREGDQWRLLVEHLGPRPRE